MMSPQSLVFAVPLQGRPHLVTTVMLSNHTLALVVGEACTRQQTRGV